MGSFDVGVVGAEDVLGFVAPTVLVAFFVRMFGSSNLSGNVDRLATEMDAGGLGDGMLLVVVFLESHD
jgi:hypothetical protein